MEFQCRTAELRKNLISRYVMKPIAHVKLLNGQERRSCTNDLLKGSYYCFSYKEKNMDDLSMFFCGKATAEHLLSLLKIPKIPIFNPLSTKGVGNGTSITTTPGTPTKNKEEWNPTAKQLHNAINLLVICWSTYPGDTLLKIKTRLEVAKMKEPFSSDVKSIDTIISKDRQKRTLQQMIEELRNNNNVRIYNFDLLNTILAKEGIAQSHFG